MIKQPKFLYFGKLFLMSKNYKTSSNKKFKRIQNCIYIQIHKAFPKNI